MGNPLRDPPADPCRLHDDDACKARGELDEIFTAGAEARRLGRSCHDNPFAAGSEERQEWDAGWRAKPEIDDDEASDG